MFKVIVIVGSTSVGKTGLAIRIAKVVGGEIVSADSRQVYRGLDIGTGKVTKREMRGVLHHLLDVADPKKVFTASDFVRLGRAAILEIAARNRIPIIVGGTGFYIDALLGTMSIPDVPPNEALRKELRAKSLEWLQKRLKKLDPKRFVAIDCYNSVRLIRAIEIATALGRVPSPAPKKLYDVLYIGLTLPPDELKKKIRMRLFARMRGIVREVKNLHRKGLSWKRMEELGLEYRYMARYLQGKLNRAEMLRELESEIVKYTKRQVTWFKRNKEIQWFLPRESRKIVELSRKFLDDSKINSD